MRIFPCIISRVTFFDVRFLFLRPDGTFAFRSQAGEFREKNILIGMGGTCNTRRDYEKYSQNFTRKLEGKRRLVRSRCRLEDNIKIYVKYTDYIAVSHGPAQWHDLHGYETWA